MAFTSDSITNPSVLYHNFISGGYPFTLRRKQQLIDLYAHMTRICEAPPDIWYIPIGSALEEAYVSDQYRETPFDPSGIDQSHHYRPSFGSQWMQLMPWFLVDNIKRHPEKTYQVTIITPSVNLDITNHAYHEPVFIRKTADTFKWKQIVHDNSLSFVSEAYNVRIDIFATLYPTYDPQQNIKIDEINDRAKTRLGTMSTTQCAMNAHKKDPTNSKLKDIYDKEMTKEHEMYDQFISRTNMFKNTHDDCNFVRAFNDSFGSALSAVDYKGMTLAFSSCTFNNHSRFSSIYSNYRLISGIIQHFPVESETRLLAEWHYSETRFVVDARTTSHERPHKSISFIEPCEDASLHPDFFSATGMFSCVWTSSTSLLIQQINRKCTMMASASSAECASASSAECASASSAECAEASSAGCASAYSSSSNKKIEDKSYPNHQVIDISRIPSVSTFKFSSNNCVNNIFSKMYEFLHQTLPNHKVNRTFIEYIMKTGQKQWVNQLVAMFNMYDLIFKEYEPYFGNEFFDILTKFFNVSFIITFENSNETCVFGRSYNILFTLNICKDSIVFTKNN